MFFGTLVIQFDFCIVPIWCNVQCLFLGKRYVFMCDFASVVAGNLFLCDVNGHATISGQGGNTVYATCANFVLGQFDCLLATDGGVRCAGVLGNIYVI